MGIPKQLEVRPMPEENSLLPIRSDRGTAVALPLEIAEQADVAASAHLFDDYRARRATRTIIVMNPNYLAEITAQASDAGLGRSASWCIMAPPWR